MPADPAQLTRSVELHVHVLDEGGFRVGPELFGPGFNVQGPEQLWRAVRHVFQSSAPPHAEAEAEATAPAAPPPPEPIRSPSYSRRAVVRPDQAAPADWAPTADGRWRSPSGRLYRRDTSVVRSVLAKRAQLGLPLAFQAAEEPQARARTPPPRWCGKVWRRRR